MHTSHEANTSDQDAIASRSLQGLLLCIATIVCLVAIETTWTVWCHHQYAEESEYQFRLDLRTASVAELLLIPGFGETLSTRWVREREQLLAIHPSAIDAIANMRGVGEQKLAVIKQFAVPDRANATSSDSSSRVALIAE